MKPLFRSPKSSPRRLALAARPALGALLVMTAFGAGAQQWTRGEMVWNNTQCGGCHVGNISLASMQSRYLTIAAARTAADQGAARNSVMGAVWGTLNNAQKDDVAAYVAGWRAEGNASVTAGTGPAMSVNALGQISEITVTLFNNGRATMAIQSNGITRTGPNASEFVIGGGAPNSCFNLSVPGNGSCQVTVTFTPSASSSGQRSATLNFAHNGEPLNTTSLALTGTVGAAPPPTPSPTPAPASDGGGGALPLTLWTALLPAALLARRRRG
jgi:cytochrome c553